MEREQERSSSLKPSSWPFLPCVNPPAATYTLLQVTCKEQPWGGADCGALRLQAESCALSPRPFCGLRGGLVSDLFLVSLLSLGLLKSLVISAGFPGRKYGRQRDDDYMDSAERNPPRGG